MKALKRLAAVAICAGSLGLHAAEPGVPAGRAPAPGSGGFGGGGFARGGEGGGGTLAIGGTFMNVVGKTEPAAFVGITASPVTAAMNDQLKLPKGIGLLVDYVEPKSPADEAGVKEHDVIEKLNDQLLVNAHQFAVLVRTFKAGDEVTLTVIHRGESKPVKTKLVEREVMALDEHNPWGAPPMPGRGPDQPGVIDVTFPPGTALGANFNHGKVTLIAPTSSQISLSDDKGTLKLTRDARTGNSVLEEIDKEGKRNVHVVKTQAEIDALPVDLRGRYEKMLKFGPPEHPDARNFHRFAPATRPSSDAGTPGFGTPTEVNYLDFGSGGHAEPR